MITWGQLASFISNLPENKRNDPVVLEIGGEIIRPNYIGKAGGNDPLEKLMTARLPPGCLFLSYEIPQEPIQILKAIGPVHVAPWNRMVECQNYEKEAASEICRNCGAFFYQHRLEVLPTDLVAQAHFLQQEKGMI